MERYKQIEALIARFLDGATTNAEERELYAFFAGGDILEHLLPYKELFVWFGEGIRDEAPAEEPLPRSRRRIGLWAAAAAAAVVAGILWLWPQVPEPAFDPFEGSYIVRGGVKITDPAIVRPAIAAMQAQWDEGEAIQQAIRDQLLQSEKESRFIEFELHQKFLK